MYIPMEGLEPSHFTIKDFESSASTIPPHRLKKKDVMGFEPILPKRRTLFKSAA